MAFRVTEYQLPSGRPLPALGIPTGNPVQTQSIVQGSSISTFALSSITGLIFIDTDVGSMVFIGTSASTQVPSASSGTLVSTAGAAIHIPANVAPFPIFVRPFSRLCSVST